MIDKKTITEAETRIKQHLAERSIKSKQSIDQKRCTFFLESSDDAIESAQTLLDITTNKSYQKYIGHEGLKGYRWIINASYYAMFYVVRSLLEKGGIKLKSDQGIHLLTFDALLCYYYLNGKLEKTLIDLYLKAQEEADELLGQRKADELISEYYYEKDKRSRVTYETGDLAMLNKAKTSLERAIRFTQEIKRIMKYLE